MSHFGPSWSDLAQAMQTAAIEAEEEKQKLKKKVKGAQNSAIFPDFAVFFCGYYVDIIGGYS